MTEHLNNKVVRYMGRRKRRRERKKRQENYPDDTSLKVFKIKN